MGDKAWFGYTLVGIIYIAILFVLVRPGSDAANAVSTISNALVTLVTTATGNTPSS